MQLDTGPASRRTPLETIPSHDAHPSSSQGSAGVLGGLIAGALLGAGLSRVISAVAHDPSGGWALVAAAVGIVVGAAVGASIGAFATLPTGHAMDEVDRSDFIDRVVFPFVLPPAIVVLIAIIIVSIGETLLALLNGEDANKFLPVGAAILGTILIGLGALYLALRQPSSSSRDTVSHSGH